MANCSCVCLHSNMSRRQPTTNIRITSTTVFFHEQENVNKHGQIKSREFLHGMSKLWKLGIYIYRYSNTVNSDIGGRSRVDFVTDSKKMSSTMYRARLEPILMLHQSLHVRHFLFQKEHSETARGADLERHVTKKAQEAWRALGLGPGEQVDFIVVGVFASHASPEHAEAKALGRGAKGGRPRARQFWFSSVDL